MCRERDSNPHSHFWPRDFKSLVSTNSTIAASFLQYRSRFYGLPHSISVSRRTRPAASGLQLYCKCKVKVLNHNIQNNLHNLIFWNGIKFTV